MQSLLGIQLPPAVIWILAFVIVFALLALMALVLRRLAGARLNLPGGPNRTRQPRLGIVDAYDLDRQRQLVIIRRDNVEHLVMIGGPNDLVIETSIVRAGMAIQPALRDPAFGGEPRIEAVRPDAPRPRTPRSPPPCRRRTP